MRVLLLALLLLAGCVSVPPVRGTCPDSHPVQVNLRSGYFHLPSSPYYNLPSRFTCYRSEREARAAGYQPGDPRFRDARLP